MASRVRAYSISTLCTFLFPLCKAKQRGKPRRLKMRPFHYATPTISIIYQRRFRCPKSSPATTCSINFSSSQLVHKYVTNHHPLYVGGRNYSISLPSFHSALSKPVLFSWYIMYWLGIDSTGKHIVLVLFLISIHMWTKYQQALEVRAVAVGVIYHKL